MNKYRNKKTTINGKTFSSKKEATRYTELALLERAGSISGLRLQVVYILAPSVVIGGRKRPPLRYLADFEYWQTGVLIVEDVKGRITDAYRIKRHLMKSVHGIDILET
jgi:hypothetical protein